MGNGNLGEPNQSYPIEMSLDTALQKLRQIGLTEYEAQAYFALVQGSQMTAEEVAANADIPLPRVYGVLDSLRDLGLIVILKGRPKKFEIVSPKEGFQHLLGVRKRSAEDSLQQLQQICREVEQVLSPLFWREHLRIRPEDLLEALESLATAETRTKEIIKGAQHSLDIFTDIFSWFGEVESDLVVAAKRGVKIRILMNKEHPSARATVQKLQASGIAVRQPSDLRFPVRGTLADGSKVVFLIWAAPEGKGGPKYVYRPSFSANEGIVAIFQHSFEFRWQQAKT